MRSDETAVTYGYGELADRIEQVLGRRPTVSSLRAGAARPPRATAAGKAPRLTAGMPAPLEQRSRGASPRFSAEQVEQWLAGHPLLTRQRARSRAETALRRSEDVDRVVEAARRSGLSWREITGLLATVPDQPRTVAGVHKRYRNPDSAT